MKWMSTSLIIREMQIKATVRYHLTLVKIVVVQSLSCVWLFVTPWTGARQASLSLPSPRVCSHSCPLSRWCHPTISLSVISSSCLPSFAASGSFQMSQFFTSGGQSIGASTSVLPMNSQDWFPLGWTGWISLQSKGLESSPIPQFKTISSSALSFLYGPALTSIHDYWKIIVLTVWTFIGFSWGFW